MPLAQQIASGQLGLAGIVEVLLKLGLVLLLIYLSFYFLKRWSQSSQVSLWELFPMRASDQLIRSAAIHRLNPTAALHLIEVDQRRFLVSVTAQNVQIMLELSPAQTIESRADENSNSD